MYIYYIYYIGGVNISPLEGPAWLYAQDIREANISRPYIAIYRIRAAYALLYIDRYGPHICNTMRITMRYRIILFAIRYATKEKKEKVRKTGAYRPYPHRKTCPKVRYNAVLRATPLRVLSTTFCRAARLRPKSYLVTYFFLKAVSFQNEAPKPEKRCTICIFMPSGIHDLSSPASDLLPKKV